MEKSKKSKNTKKTKNSKKVKNFESEFLESSIFFKSERENVKNYLNNLKNVECCNNFFSDNDELIMTDDMNDHFYNEIKK